jgi:hypothetical protein
VVAFAGGHSHEAAARLVASDHQACLLAYPVLNCPQEAELKRLRSIERALGVRPDPELQPALARGSDGEDEEMRENEGRDEEMSDGA